MEAIKKTYEEINRRESLMYDSFVNIRNQPGRLDVLVRGRLASRAQFSLVVGCGMMRALNLIGHTFDADKVARISNELHPLIRGVIAHHGTGSGYSWSNYKNFQATIDTHVDGFIVKDGKVQRNRMNGKTTELIMLISICDYVKNWEFESDKEACIDLGKLNSVMAELWALVPEFQKLDEAIC